MLLLLELMMHHLFPHSSFLCHHSLLMHKHVIKMRMLLIHEMLLLSEILFHRIIYIQVIHVFIQSIELLIHHSHHLPSLI